jgi:hypothetical protein
MCIRVQGSLAIVSWKPQVCWIFQVINRRLFCSHFCIFISTNLEQAWFQNFTQKKPYLMVINKIKYLHNIDDYTRSGSCQWFWNPTFFRIQKIACKQQMPLSFWEQGKHLGNQRYQLKALLLLLFEMILVANSANYSC